MYKYKLVPLVPTDEMVLRGADSIHSLFRSMNFNLPIDCMATGEIEKRIAESCYNAMMELVPAAKQEPVEINFPEYHPFGMRCGLEDHGITDRHAAMEYGWYKALNRMDEELEHLGPLYQCPHLLQDATEQINALRAELDESQANDRTAMSYLAEIRAIVGGKDFPEMVSNVAALVNAVVPAAQGEPVAWYTEDHLNDKSATTWSKDVAERWRAKGWPVENLYAAQQPAPDVSALVEAAAELAHYADGMDSIIRDLAGCPGKADALAQRVTAVGKLLELPVFGDGAYGLP